MSHHMKPRERGDFLWLLLAPTLQDPAGSYHCIKSAGGPLTGRSRKWVLQRLASAITQRNLDRRIRSQNRPKISTTSQVISYRKKMLH